MGRTNNTHCKLIKAYLESGHSIDSEIARTLFGCHRLASRISELRTDKYGNIAIKVAKRAAKYGDNYFAVYSL